MNKSKIQNKVVFSILLIRFWIKGSIMVDEHQIITSISNVVLGIIPLGKNEKQFTLRNIQGVQINTKFNIGSFLLGFLLTTLGLFAYIFSIILVPIGVIIFLNGILTSITITGNGDDYKIEVPFFEKSKILEINKSIQEALIYRENKEVNAIYEASIINANTIVNAINSRN
ncbi:MAG: hypothetical protein FWF57_09515 [Defluviitaleaceae bacterium]|nr:hypothetical protein [Defluviitaleaceae bacterium]